MNEGMDSLIQMRREWVESNKKNNFDNGIKRLLTELYPDNAHFIYELLQNAEDTGASIVRFKLTHEALDFEHNGQRLFTLSDVTAITSIGVSTKRDDPTSIGKFGVGFKAVFAYTNTPEIQSGDFHFRIHELVVPEKIDQRRTNRTQTLFSFPFDHPKKPAEQLVTEITEGLKSLGDNTLLFLNNIKRIVYYLPDENRGIHERIEHDAGRIEIRTFHPSRGEMVSQWLKFSKVSPITDDDGNPKECCVSIAYSLISDDRKNMQTEFRIVPLDRGQVSIFFPAEKETSNLRFHIHAPFASTVARDSIRECLANRRLCNLISELIVESMHDIRNKCMLDVSFLAVLPNPEDNLPALYEPIRKAIVTAFQEAPLVPMKLGGHEKASSIYRGPTHISEVLDDAALSFLLCKDQNKLWAANAPQENQREDRFLTSLAIPLWGWTACYNFINGLKYFPTDQKRFEQWFAKKEDSWLIRFYALLGEACNKRGISINLDNLHIVRVDTENGDRNVTPNEAYFPPEHSKYSSPDILFVKQTVYAAGKSQFQLELAFSFLKHIGVRTCDIEAFIKHKLKAYGRNELPHSPESHLDDIRQFVAFSTANPGKIGIFLSNNFLYANTVRVGDQLSPPSKLFFDMPYRDSGLCAVFADPKLRLFRTKLKIADDYYAIKDFIGFGIALGIIQQLEIYEGKATITQKDFFQKPTRSSRATIDRDYTLNRLNPSASGGYSCGDIDLNIRSFALSQAIWRVMSTADPKVLEACYITNQRHEQTVKRKTSFLVDCLSQSEWLPDKDGVFFRPENISRHTLHPEFVIDDQNGWLTAIGFGKSDRKLSEEFQARDANAKALGFTTGEIAAEWAKVAQLGIPPFLIISQHKPPDQPEEAVPDPSRRRNGIKEIVDNAPLKGSEMKTRSIDPETSPEIDQAKTYLRAKYKNRDAQLICQCCHQEMPFKLSSGDHYFEAVQCVSGIEKHSHFNRLALCPNCAAMYKYAPKTPDADIRNRILQQATSDQTASIDISIDLAGREMHLHFVTTHLFDLKTLLEETSQSTS